MRPRPSAYDEAIARRLELLSAELAHDDHTRIRTAGPDPAAVLEEGPPVGAPGVVGAAQGGGAAEVVAVAEVPRPGRHAARRRAGPPASLVPESWRESAALGPGPVAVLAVLAALGLAACCWWLLRSQPEPVTLESAAAPAGLVTPLVSGAGPAASASPAAEIVVDVAGEVRRPGIAVLDPGSRVIDAIRAAGGARRGVDLSTLNLARPLVDGEQVLVGVPPVPGAASMAPGGAASPGAAAAPLDLNTATSAQLEELPGVGPVTAEAIIAFRTEHGPFGSVEELLDVSGIGEATLAEIAPHVTV